MTAGLAATLLLLVATSATALDPGKRPSQYVHRAWTEEQGLPSASITALGQDADGFLWIGTNNGLARFDGQTFVVYDRRTPAALPSNSIAAILQDRRGTLWIGTLGGGLLRRRGEAFEAVASPERIVALAVADEGVWVGGYGGLARVRDDGDIQRWDSAAGVVGDPVWSVQADTGASAWFVTPRAVQRLIDDRVEHVPWGEAPTEQTWRDLFRLRDGTLVVRSLEGQLWRRRDGSLQRWLPPAVPAAASVRWLIEDREGSLWLGTEQHGLFRIGPAGTTAYTLAEGFPAGRVRTLFEDDAGSLWLGSSDTGLHRFRDGAFTTWGTPEGLPSDAVYAVREDAEGRILIGTGAGLARFGDAGLEVVTDGFTNTSIRALHVPPGGDALWIGGMAGVERVADGRLRDAFSMANGLPVNRVTVVHTDRRGVPWFGTFGGGLVAQAPDGLRVLQAQPDGLADDFVFALHERPDGALVVGTGHGISVVQGGRVIDAGPLASITAPVTAFHEDERGVLWIGTEDGGLYRHASNVLSSLAAVRGFPDDTMYCILPDDHGRLWFSSYRGVFSVARDELDAAAAGRLNDVVAEVYGPSDGLRSREGNGGQQPAGWRDAAGRLWFATLKGVSMRDPAQVLAEPAALRVRIDALFADDRLLDRGAPLRLPPGTQRLEVRYTAPSLVAADQTRFRLRLEGFDEDWREVGTRRDAQFTGLPWGDYRLRIAARAGKSPWGSDEAAIAFSIAPFFHQTWWFLLLVGVVAVTLILGAFWLRLAWLESQNAVLRERQRIAGEIHDNLAQSFSGVIQQAEAALGRFRTAPEAAAQHLEAVCDLATYGADAARRSMWELGARREGSDSLERALSSAGKRLTQSRGIDFRVESSGEPRPLPRVTEHQLLCITQAAIANAVEHSGAGAIVLRLDHGTRRLVLRVEDDGRGFDPSERKPAPGRGYGLENLAERAAEIGAVLRIDSGPGRGTQIEVSVARRQWTRLLRNALRWRGREK